MTLFAVLVVLLFLALLIWLLVRVQQDPSSTKTNATTLLPYTSPANKVNRTTLGSGVATTNAAAGLSLSSANGVTVSGSVAGLSPAVPCTDKVVSFVPPEEGVLRIDVSQDGKVLSETVVPLSQASGGKTVVVTETLVEQPIDPSIYYTHSDGGRTPGDSP
jgi:hypothetical protein